MIVGLYDDFSCAYIVKWCRHEYLRLYDNLAHVRVQAFIEQVSFRDIHFIYRSNEERHECPATCGAMSGGHCQQYVIDQL